MTEACYRRQPFELGAESVEVGAPPTNGTLPQKFLIFLRGIYTLGRLKMIVNGLKEVSTWSPGIFGQPCHWQKPQNPTMPAAF